MFSWIYLFPPKKTHVNKNNAISINSYNKRKCRFYQEDSKSNASYQFSAMGSSKTLLDSAISRKTFLHIVTTIVYEFLQAGNECKLVWHTCKHCLLHILMLSLLKCIIHSFTMLMAAASFLSNQHRWMSVYGIFSVREFSETLLSCMYFKVILPDWHSAAILNNTQLIVFY